MSDLNYITEMLELKDKNIKFFENRWIYFEIPFYYKKLK